MIRGVRGHLRIRRGLRLVAIVVMAAVVPASAGQAAVSPTTYVNPFSGTRAGATDFGTGGGAGNTFPGPVAPFGMIQLGPDTWPVDEERRRRIRLRRREDQRVQPPPLEWGGVCKRR